MQPTQGLDSGGQTKEVISVPLLVEEWQQPPSLCLVLPCN